MAADDDVERFLSAYLVDEEEDDAAVAAKAEREKRRAAGDWDMERILEKGMEQTREICRQHREELNRQDEELRINDVGDDQKKHRAAPPQMPMRHYAACLGGPELASSANVLAVRVVRSAAGYPVDVYGHVFVRDDLDGRRVYLFRRGRDKCQRINSKDDVLTLTGPSRGLLLRRDIHFEINLKSKSHRAEDDREITRCYLKNQVTTSTYKVVRNRVAGRHCTIDLTYAPVHQAVEATIELKIDEILTTTRVSRRGNTVREWLPFGQARKEHHPKFLFRGKVTAGISGVWEDDVVLYDSEADGTVTAVSDQGFIQLSRRVVSLPITGTSLLLKVAPITPLRSMDAPLAATPSSCAILPTNFLARSPGRRSTLLRSMVWRAHGFLHWNVSLNPREAVRQVWQLVPLL